MKEFMDTILFNHSALQAVVVIFLIIVVGLLLGRLKVKGISLGVTFVFFCGIIAGHFGLGIDPAMLSFAQNFGLVIFVYALGLQVGPGFFNSFRKGGLELNALAVGVVLLGTLFALGLTLCTGVSLPDMVGILCGATTNTPALAAAQQTLSSAGLDAASPALACAATYPLGVVGVILAMIFMRKVLIRPSDPLGKDSGTDSTYIATFFVQNPAIFGKTVQEVSRITKNPFIISRLWRAGKVIIPDSTSVLQKDDRILVITSVSEVGGLSVLFGQKEDVNWNRRGIDWNAIDSQLESHWLIVTRPEINGRTIGSLRLRNRFGVNITRIHRAGMMLLAGPDTVLHMGDRLIVVGHGKGLSETEKVLGNKVGSLREPNLVSICVGIILGLVLGSIPIRFPGMDAPLKLGLAGGPIVVGILMGAFGPRIHMVTYTTESANLMLRKLGLALYLACLGLDSGREFFSTLIRPEGLLWVGLGFLLTVIPVLVMGIVSMRGRKQDFSTTCGMLCGAMANPMALTYAADSLPQGNPTLAYTQVYPLCMFLRVILSQLILILFI